MPRNLRNAVVVITGASSGIGRATALEFAQRGANVVLAARREQPLHELAVECQRSGVGTLVVPTDMTDETAVQRLAQQTLSTFGTLDIWVNNHGVYVAARFEETPMEDFRQLIETNLFGVIHGSRAALPIFRRQQRGVLINVGSMVSQLAAPYFSAYTASKHAVRGLGMSLRQELALDGLKNVRVCTVMPASIDTPLFQHAANYTGRALRAMPPVYSPERVARTIVDLGVRPKSEVFVGNIARLMKLQHLFAPNLTERQIALFVDKTHFKQEQPTPHDKGNLFAPVQEGDEVRGGWQNPIDPVLRRVATGALVAIPAALLWRRLRQR